MSGKLKIYICQLRNRERGDIKAIHRLMKHLEILDKNDLVVWDERRKIKDDQILERCK